MMEAVRAVIRLWQSPSTTETYLAAGVAAVVLWQILESGDRSVQGVGVGREGQ